MSDDDPRVVLMHPVLVPDFVAWLGRRGLELRPGPEGVWIITPTDERMAEVERASREL